MALVVCAGCLTKGQPSEDDAADTEPDVVVDSGETAIPWLGETDAGVPEDTFRLTDRPIGPTALDGTWTGTFTLTSVVPFSRDGVAAGEVTFTVDGDAERHVVATFHAETWDPNVSLGRPYGVLDGIGFATLDPADLSGFRLDVSFGARNMGTFSKDGMRVRLVDDRLTVDFSDVVGFGDLKAGNKLVVDAGRGDPGGSP